MKFNDERIESSEKKKPLVERSTLIFEEKSEKRIAEWNL